MSDKGALFLPLRTCMFTPGGATRINCARTDKGRPVDSSSLSKVEEQEVLFPKSLAKGRDKGSICFGT